jgi:uncharacterized membrane protein YdjX (TVP38/TMEM64 family)
VRARRAGRLLALAACAGLAALAVVCVVGALPDATWLQAQQAQLQALQAAAPLGFAAGFLLLFTLMSALALPGCSLLCLAAGLLFGTAAGTALVVLASTLGACLPFLGARHLWRDALQRRWGERLAPMERALERDGAWVLFALRVAPVVPYSLVNPLMGLTRMPLAQFFVVSGLGMLAGSAAYVHAGSVLGRAAGWHDLFTPGLAAALAALALLPLVLRRALDAALRRRGAR